jgi:hypothetical protein
MRLRLLRKWENHGDEYPVGTIISISKGLAKRMIAAKIAEEYRGPYPPRKKMRTDLFKPKE